MIQLAALLVYVGPERANSHVRTVSCQARCIPRETDKTNNLHVLQVEVQYMQERFGSVKSCVLLGLIVVAVNPLGCAKSLFFNVLVYLNSVYAPGSSPGVYIKNKPYFVHGFTFLPPLSSFLKRQISNPPTPLPPMFKTAKFQIRLRCYQPNLTSDSSGSDYWRLWILAGTALAVFKFGVCGCCSNS